ncbi:hypothetical protein OPIT5_30650 [Opitutaceae bacterium TAV5]|nr:hypothetical protein OPIT5_30650 [Opitutaceae bacterium TAV5]
MNRTEKAGWIALCVVLLVISAIVGVLLYSGPGEIQREIKRISKPEVYEALFEPAIRLYESLLGDASLGPEDIRAADLRAIIAPATYSYIAKSGKDMFIECGGGFLHYGFRLIRDEYGTYLLILEVEEKEDKTLMKKGA